MLLSSVHYDSKLNYKSHLLPVSVPHKLSLALPRSAAALCKASRAGEKTVYRKVAVCFSLNYGLVISTRYIRSGEKWGVCSAINQRKTKHLGKTLKP